ncbi:MAG TPA: response regulator [Pyrinomonadaceae bacterium]|jgi:CheY-like chemotaxis protein
MLAPQTFAPAPAPPRAHCSTAGYPFGPPPGPAAGPGEPSATPRAKPRALVVDDAPDVTEMIAVLLQHAGYDAAVAYSGPEALAAARAERFDALISDIGMPGMNGYELARQVRRLPGYERVPMIAVTGFTMYDDRERALASGFDAFLTKPLSPADLLTLLNGLRG